MVKKLHFYVLPQYWTYCTVGVDYVLSEPTFSTIIGIILVPMSASTIVGTNFKPRSNFLFFRLFVLNMAPSVGFY